MQQRKKKAPCAGSESCSGTGSRQSFCLSPWPSTARMRCPTGHRSGCSGGTNSCMGSSLVPWRSWSCEPSVAATAGRPGGPPRALFSSPFSTEGGTNINRDTIRPGIRIFTIGTPTSSAQARFSCPPPQNPSWPADRANQLNLEMRRQRAPGNVQYRMLNLEDPRGGGSHPSILGIEHSKLYN